VILLVRDEASLQSGDVAKRILDHLGLDSTGGRR
jgi:hypothetical protein